MAFSCGRSSIEVGKQRLGVGILGLILGNKQHGVVDIGLWYINAAVFICVDKFSGLAWVIVISETLMRCLLFAIFYHQRPIAY